MAYYNDSKITYQQLVMEQIQKIQNICSKELRDGDKILKNAMGEQVIEGEDTRYSFLQSVELLGSMLSPYFGTMMKSEDGKDDLFEDFCEYYDAELVELIDNEDFQKKISEMFGVKSKEELENNKSLQTQINVFLLNDKIKEARKIFRLLIKVFKSNNFLGESAFGDGGSDDTGSLDAVEDEEEDILEL